MGFQCSYIAFFESASIKMCMQIAICNAANYCACDNRAFGLSQCGGNVNVGKKKSFLLFYVLQSSTVESEISRKGPKSGAVKNCQIRMAIFISLITDTRFSLSSPFETHSFGLFHVIRDARLRRCRCCCDFKTKTSFFKLSSEYLSVLSTHSSSIFYDFIYISSSSIFSGGFFFFLFSVLCFYCVLFNIHFALDNGANRTTAQ